MLARGFALVRTGDGTPVRAAKAITPGAAIEIEFADGRVAAIAEGGDTGTPPKPRKPEARAKATRPDAPDLFG